MRIGVAAVAAVAALPLGCHPRPITEPAPPGFQPTGQVVARSYRSAGGAEADLDDRHVTSRRLDLTLGADGSWSGTIDGRPTVLRVEGDRLVGPGLDLRIDRSEGVLRFDGTVGGRTMRAALSWRGLSGYSYSGGCEFDYLPLGPDVYRGAYQCPPTLRRPSQGAEVWLRGEAASEEAPLPQTALALLSVLPPY